MRFLRTMSKVSIISGKNHYQGVYQALKLIKKEIREKIADKQRIVIKPNLCVNDNQLAVTDVEAVTALLDFLKRELDVSQNIKIAEGPFDGGLEQCLNAYSYQEKLANYPVKFIDLNYDETKRFEVFYNSRSVKLNLAKTILDSDFLISICPAKTHDAVITTLSIKNVAVGSIVVSRLPPGIGNYTRMMIHGSSYKINKVLASVAKLIWPDLAIIDGIVAMEGNGPTSHEAVDFDLVFASLDPLAADSICSYLMGFNPRNIGYYYYLDKMGLGTNDLAKIQVLGIKDLERYKKIFKPHTSYQNQLNWRQNLKEPKIKSIIKFIKKAFNYGKTIV